MSRLAVPSAASGAVDRPARDFACFSGPRGDITAIATPFVLDAFIAQWSGLRRKMVRDVDPAFTRDEWAYLATFIGSDALTAVFRATFGERTERGPIDRLLRPRGPVALWLPNNVSLLGPLTLVLVSLTGNPLWVKAGSRSDDLCSAFAAWALRNLDDGPLKNWLRDDVKIAALPRGDERLLRWSAQAAVRIVFGGDAGAAAVAALPSQPTAPLFAFVNKRSEAWCDASLPQAGDVGANAALTDDSLRDNGALTDDKLRAFIKVFAIYGRAGCTSPSRLVLIDGSDADCTRVANRLIELWPSAVRTDVPMHRASANVLAAQVARAGGWRATLVARNAAVVCTGPHDTEPPEGHLTLAVVAAPLAEAVAGLPDNIQTLGTISPDLRRARWLAALAQSPVKRIVPVAQMHHFGPVWDGYEFWRQLFEAVELC